ASTVRRRRPRALRGAAWSRRSALREIRLPGFGCSWLRSTFHSIQTVQLRGGAVAVKRRRAWILALSGCGAQDSISDAEAAPAHGFVTGTSGFTGRDRLREKVGPAA